MLLVTEKDEDAEDEMRCGGEKRRREGEEEKLENDKQIESSVSVVSMKQEVQEK